MRVDNGDCWVQSYQLYSQGQMIKTVFTIANNLVKKFRCSPTAIIEGREYDELQKMVEREENYQLKRIAEEQIFKARQATTECPFERERQKIVYQYADPRVNLTFQEAWKRMDEVQQRESDQAWKEFKGQ